MERQERDDLQNRFRELAAEVGRLHEQWRRAAERGDIETETRLIEQEAELLAEIDAVIRTFGEGAAPRKS